MEMLYKTDMITIIFAFKIFVLGILLIMSGVSFLHMRETGRMENRLGILLPQPVRALSSLHFFLTIATIVAGCIFLLF